MGFQTLRRSNGQSESIYEMKKLLDIDWDLEGI